MNTSERITNTEIKEFRVKLKGAYEGNYRMFWHITPKGSPRYQYFVFTDTKIHIHIHNEDIVDLVVEAIIKR